MRPDSSYAKTTVSPRAASLFTNFARWTAHTTGRPTAFLLAVMVIVAWGITGPMFHYSDTWQLVINTGTTIVTFLMVFLIQNTQNRDSQALHVKLDELIRAVKGARNSMLDLEGLSDEELGKIKSNYIKLAARAQHDATHRGDPKSTGITEK